MALRLLSGPGLAPTTPPCLEEWLVERGPGAEPALFVYSWGAPALVLGYGQGADEVDLAACEADGVTVLRRRTGGTGVFVDGDLGVALGACSALNRNAMETPVATSAPAVEPVENTNDRLLGCCLGEGPQTPKRSPIALCATGS